MIARPSLPVNALPEPRSGKASVTIRVALYIATLVLAIQLFSMGFPRHALTEQVSDCVSCYSASQLLGDAPVATLTVAAAVVAVYCQLLSLPTSRFVDVALFFTPPSHAPPALS